MVATACYQGRVANVADVMSGGDKGRHRRGEEREDDKNDGEGQR